MKDDPSSSIEELKTTEKLILYPNPTNGNLTFSTKKTFEQAFIEILTVDGKTLRSINFESNDKIHFTIDGPKGVYFVNIILDEQEEQMIKVVKN